MTSDNGGPTMTNKPLIIAGTIVILAILGTFTAISLGGRDTTNLGELLQQIATVVAAVGGVGGLAAATKAAGSARAAATASEAARQQTNGSLDARLSAAVADGNAYQLAQLAGYVRQLVDERHAAIGAAAVQPAAPENFRPDRPSSILEAGKSSV